MSFAIGTMLLAIVTAVACALPGTFVVLRRWSMLVDAIAQSVLPGIVVGYFITRNFDSPLLIFGSALAGLLVVLGAEWLSRTGLLTGDTPQGLIFPALFSGGVILVSMNFANIHLDTHMVLAGDLNITAFRHLIIGGVSVGPSYMYVMLAVLLVNVTFLTVFYSKLKVTTFDPEFAGSLGIRTGLINTAFMFLVSVTFNASGAILVIALVVVPPATAYLLSTRLPVMMTLTVIIASVGAVAGFWVAYILDAATSAGMAVFYGIMFAAVLVGTRLAQRRRQLAHHEISALASAQTGPPDVTSDHAGEHRDSILESNLASAGEPPCLRQRYRPHPPSRQSPGHGLTGHQATGRGEPRLPRTIRPHRSDRQRTQYRAPRNPTRTDSARISLQRARHTLAKYCRGGLRNQSCPH